MTPGYDIKLGLKVYSTNVQTQKIDRFTFKIFGMILASLQVENKLGQARFFQKTFLLANISLEILLSMLFLTFNNTNIQFAKKKLT